MSFVQISETAVSECLSCASSRMNVQNNLATITHESPTICSRSVTCIQHWVIVGFDACEVHILPLSSYLVRLMAGGQEPAVFVTCVS